MPLFASSTPFDPDVEKATSELNTTEDWGLIMDIIDKVSTTTNGPRDCLRSIVKRMNHKVPFVSMQALTLLDACVNNCGKQFHLEIASRDFISEARTLIGQKAHPKVAQRLKYMVKKWAEMKEFKDDPSLNLVPSFYDSLKKEGADFSDPDATPKKTVAFSADPNVAQSREEEDDLAKAIQLSLQDNQRSQVKTQSLYPTGMTGYPSTDVYASSSKPKELRKVKALYDFEAAEDNELTFKAGELISVIDDSDPNWWKGFNHRGEGLFPANFATADLTVEPEEPEHLKKVHFNEEVQVKTVETAPEDVEIDEEKIDKVLQLIQNADPTGETQPDSQEMLQLEEQCKAMGPLIDCELEKIDKKYAGLCELNTKIMESLQMYHNLMKETPTPYIKGGMSAGTYSLPMQMPPPQDFSSQMYNGQPQFIPQINAQVGGQMSVPNQGQMTVPSQGQMPQMTTQVQGQVPQMPQPAQNYVGQVPNSQNYSSNATDPQQMYSRPPVRPDVSSVQSHNPPQNNIQSQPVLQNNYSVHPVQQQFYQPQQQPLL